MDGVRLWRKASAWKRISLEGDLQREDDPGCMASVGERVTGAKRGKNCLEQTTLMLAFVCDWLKVNTFKMIGWN